MTKQLTFQQSFRNGRTVNREERPLATAAMLIEGAGHQLFAGAALSQDQDHPAGGRPVRCSRPGVQRRGRPTGFVCNLCLTAQGLNGDPVYLLDKFMCYRFKLFQDGDGFIKLCAGR